MQKGNKNSKNRSVVQSEIERKKLQKTITDITNTFSKRDMLFSSFNEKILKSRDGIMENVKEFKHNLTDAYGNKLLGIGKDDKRKQFSYWDLTNDVNNWPLWLAMYNDSWIFRKAIDKPSQDIVNLDVKLIGETDSSKLDELKKDLNRLTFQLIQLLMWGALFGGSVGIMLFDNIELSEMHTPLDNSKVKNSKSLRLYILDRWNGISPSTNDLVTRPSSIDFLKPKYYDVYIGNERYKVHHSYVLRYEHRIAPNLLKNGQFNGWGYPEGCHLLNELMRDEKLKDSIVSLIDKSLIEVIKMKGMRGVFMGAEAGNQQQLQQRLEMVNWARNYNSLTFLDSDDDYQQNEFGGLSGLSDLMDKNMETIAAALDMTGILYGDMSGGFSPDNFALVRYDTTIRNRAESYYRPVLEKLIKVLCWKNDISEKIEFEFESMIKEEDHSLEKMQTVVGIISSMLSDGYLTVDQAAKEIQAVAQETGIGKTITDESIEKLKENSSEEDENVLDSMMKDLDV